MPAVMNPPSPLRQALEDIARDLHDLARPGVARARRRRERAEALAEGRKALARLRMLADAPGSAAAGVLAGGPVGRAIEALETAIMTLDRIGGLLAQALELTGAAAAAEDDGARALYAERYDELREEIDCTARTAYANRVNLLDGLGQALDVPVGGRGHTTVVISGFDATSAETGLALPPPSDGFASLGEIAAVELAIEAARSRLSAYAERLQMDTALLAARLTGLTGTGAK